MCGLISLLVKACVGGRRTHLAATPPILPLPLLFICHAHLPLNANLSIDEHTAVFQQDTPPETIHFHQQPHMTKK